LRQANARVAARLQINKFNARFQSLFARNTGPLNQFQLNSLNHLMTTCENILANAQSGTLTQSNLVNLNAAFASAAIVLTGYVSSFVLKFYFQETTGV
jgi:hypothetical protein